MSFPFSLCKKLSTAFFEDDLGLTSDNSSVICNKYCCEKININLCETSSFTAKVVGKTSPVVA